MIYLVGFLSFLTVFLFVQGTYAIINKERIALSLRMQGIANTLSLKPGFEDELSKPFFDRAVRPILERFAQSVNRTTPVKKKASLQKKLIMAGNPANLSTGEFLVIQYGLTIGLPASILILTLPVDIGTIFRVLVVGTATLVGFLLPEYYLKILSNRRKEEIQDNLPDVLDLMTVSVEAGLGFDAALVKVTEKVKGVISQEFTRVLQEIKMGKPRRDALRDLGNRSGVDDLIAFLGSVIQADQLGVSIGNVLRLQSEQMRQKRRQRAEEKAMKAPIKMLIPLILFIFPTIFIVVLGPAVIQIIKTF